MFHVITILQVDCFGQGKHREFTLHKRAAELDDTYDRIASAYNLKSTEVRCDGELVTL